PGALFAGDRLELMALGRPRAKRFLDEQRLVDELILRRDQRQGCTLPGQVPQCEQALEAGDASAYDQHTRLRTALPCDHAIILRTRRKEPHRGEDPSRPVRVGTLQRLTTLTPGSVQRRGWDSN